MQNLARTNPTLSYWTRLLQGKVGRNSVPLHPAIVHAPVILLPLALIFDWLVFAPGLTWLLGVHHSQLHVFAFYLNILALLGSIPAGVTGLAEFVEVPLEQPQWNKVFAHMSLNTFALFVSLINWWSRHSADNFEPSWGLMILNMITLGGVFLSAHIGGMLVYQHGMGVQRQGDGLKQKKKEAERRYFYPNLTGTGSF